MDNKNDLKVCYWCMNKLEEGEVVCPHCNKSVSDMVSNTRGLAAGTILNDKYMLGNVIREGGFGITYIALDTIINTKIAIKEYFPSDYATRDTTLGDSNDLVVLTGDSKQKFKKGMQKFADEAKRLALFNKEAGIVSVKDFFYENETAYIVMEYIEGESLADMLKKAESHQLSWLATINMVAPSMYSITI